MRKILYIIILYSLFSCKKDCVEVAGKIVRQEIEVAFFDKIQVNPGVELVIEAGDTQRVIVEAGENKLDNFSMSVQEGKLTMEADQACVFQPLLKPVKVFITSPNIKWIQNASEHTISSKGILGYPELKLLSTDEDDLFNFGDFALTLNSVNVVVISNGNSIIHLNGTVQNLELYYYAGIGRFEGADLLANNVHLFHRGDNNLHIHPKQRLKGDLYATGNVIAYYRPPVVEVTEHFYGQLYFRF